MVSILVITCGKFVGKISKTNCHCFDSGNLFLLSWEKLQCHFCVYWGSVKCIFPAICTRNKCVQVFHSYKEEFASCRFNWPSFRGKIQQCWFLHSSEMYGQVAWNMHTAQLTWCGRCPDKSQWIECWLFVVLASPYRRGKAGIIVGKVGDTYQGWPCHSTFSPVLTFVSSSDWQVC